MTASRLREIFTENIITAATEPRLVKSGHPHDNTHSNEPTFFERYGDNFNPQTGLGDIEIWLPLKA